MSDPRIGGIATFTGFVRGDPGVIGVEFDCSNEFLEDKINTIVEDLKKREGIIDVTIEHNTGRLDVGEQIAHFVVSGSHREEILSTLADAIDYVKKEVHVSMREIKVE